MEDEGSRYRAGRHELSTTFRFTAATASMLPLQCLVKFYSCHARSTERPHQDHDVQPLHTKHEYGSVHTTPARQVLNDYNLQKVDDPGATVPGHVSNDLKLYRQRTLEIEGDDVLQP